jgi:hypothetical protein
VYELTGWKYTIGRFHDDGSYDGYVGHRGIAYTPNPQNAEWLPKDIPLYTSDYLLEKLPKKYNNGILLLAITNSTQWGAEYYSFYPPERGAKTDVYISDTPLKALLKLTIDLSEAGELK